MISLMPLRKIILQWIILFLGLFIILFPNAEGQSNYKNVSLSSNSSEKRFRWILDKPRCNDSRRNNQVDLYISKLIGFGQNGRKFPESFRQVKSYCNETRQMLTYIESYLSDCFQPDIQKLANILMFTLKRHMRIFCTRKLNNRKLKKLISLMPCLNQHILVDKCISTMVNQTSELIPLSISGKDKIKYVCCYYAELVRCGDHSLESIPCINKDRELLLDFLRGLSNDIVSLACSDYNEYTDRCNRLESLVRPPGTPKGKQYGSFLNLIIDMIESMDTLVVE